MLQPVGGDWGNRQSGVLPIRGNLKAFCTSLCRSIAAAAVSALVAGAAAQAVPGACAQ